MNARGIVIVSYHSYLIIDLIWYLSLFTVTLYMYFKYFFNFYELKKQWQDRDIFIIFYQNLTNNRIAK
jgi:hypothetical protein